MINYVFFSGFCKICVECFFEEVDWVVELYLVVDVKGVLIFLLVFIIVYFLYYFVYFGVDEYFKYLIVMFLVEGGFVFVGVVVVG